MNKFATKIIFCIKYTPGELRIKARFSYSFTFAYHIIVFKEWSWSNLNPLLTKILSNIVFQQVLMYLIVSRELNFLIIFLNSTNSFEFNKFIWIQQIYLNSTNSFEINKFIWNQQFIRIHQWIHYDVLMNSLSFLHEFTRIPQWIL